MISSWFLARGFLPIRASTSVIARCCLSFRSTTVLVPLLRWPFGRYYIMIGLAMKQMQIKVLLLLFITSLVLIFLDSRRVLEPVRSVAQSVAVPVTYSLYSAKRGAVDFFSFLKFWRSGEARIRNLEQRNLELVVFENQAKRLAAENGELRKQLGVRVLPEKRMLPAAVLSVGQYLEIGAGQADGVREGQSVIYLDNLVGKVVQVTNRQSFVQLPTDSVSRIPVKVNRVSGLVSGQFNSSMLLDKVAQNEEIKIDDLVMTSGEGDSFEPNLILGKIKKITSSQTDLFQKAEVEPLIDYRGLILCYVIIL